MTNYYIDFDTGSDSNNGTSTSTPWKHCPGDTNFTGSHTVVAGDTFSFKGGVIYRGQITVSGTGTSTSKITYNSYGTGKAIIDGSDIWSPTWTQCTSSNDCYGNTNYANIWYATAPTSFSTFKPIYEDGEFVWFSQSPNPSNRIFYDRYQDFKILQTGITRTSITDSSVFSQSDATYWNDAYVMIRKVPNVVTTRQILTFAPSTNTVTFDDIGGNLYGTDDCYAIVGHPICIDTNKEFGFKDNKIYIWTDNPNNHTYSVSSRKVGFQLNACSNIIIDNIVIQGVYGLVSQEGSAIVDYTFKTVNNIYITNCEIKNCRALASTGAIGLYKCTTGSISNNYIHDCQNNTGILCYSNYIKVDSNIINYVGYVGIWFMDATYSSITRNILTYINGTHANGISVYQGSGSGCLNILVANNSVTCGGENFPFTCQLCENVWVIGNLFDGMGESNTFMDFGDMIGTNYLLNNTIVGCSNSNYIESSQNAWKIRNNIIDPLIWLTSSLPPTDKQYNLYTTYSWQQNGQYWTLGTGEIHNTDNTIIFTDYTNSDYTLKDGSPAINAGTDVSAYYPTSLFPDYDFTKDITGKSRVNWDIGAYFYGDTPIPPIGTKKCYGFMINGRYFFLQT